MEFNLIMMTNMIAIITARGGSKRIPRKNINNFLGKPILQYSIEAAINSQVFSEVMVSTDDAEIAAIAKKNGAHVPFLRSEKTANDFATTADVLIEVLQQYEKLGKHFSHACCIYPTAPFVTPEKLQHAQQKLISSDADCVLPVTAFGFPIWRAFQIIDEKVKYQWPENAKKRSQDLTPAYHDCGQFYFFNAERFLKSGQLITDNTLPIIVPEAEVQDIDTPEDWKMAELKYTLLFRK